MNDEVFRKTEGRLYRYYRQVKEIDKLKHNIAFLEEQIKQIEHDIATTNVHLDTELNMGIDYSRDRVQTSSTGSGFAESETIRQVENLERELEYKKRKKVKLNIKLREKESQAEDIRYNIETLNKQYQMFVELKYRDCLSDRAIAKEMHMDHATASRCRHDIVEDIAHWCKLI